MEVYQTLLDEYKSTSSQAESLAKEARSLLEKFRKELAKAFTIENLVGKEFLYYKENWYYGRTLSGQVELERFCSSSGEFLFTPIDILDGVHLLKIISDAEMKTNDIKILPVDKYLLCIIPDYDYQPDNAIDWGEKHIPAWEYLYVKLESK